MQGLPSSLRTPKGANPQTRKIKMTEKDSTPLGSPGCVSIEAPTTTSPSPCKSQPSTTTSQSGQQAVEELNIFVPKVTLDYELYRRGLLTMRLEKERGKGEPPVVVPNNMVLYFGYERFWFEPTKFGSTLRASHIVEPEYYSALLGEILGTEEGIPAPQPAPAPDHNEEPLYWYKLLKKTMPEFSEMREETGAQWGGPEGSTVRGTAFDLYKPHPVNQ